MALSEEAFGRSIRSMSDEEVFELEKTVRRVATPMICSKTAGDLMRRFSDGEIFGDFMCHGQPVNSDDLADVYSNRPFGKVFAAIRNVQDFLKPMFDAAGPMPFNPQPQAYTSRKVRDKMLELRDQGKSVREIAAAVKKDKSTVHRCLKRILAERNGDGNQ